MQLYLRWEQVALAGGGIHVREAFPIELSNGRADRQRERPQRVYLQRR